MMNQLEFVDDTALVEDSGKKKLQRMVAEFAKVCARNKLRVNVRKSKLMKCDRLQDGGS